MRKKRRLLSLLALVICGCAASAQDVAFIVNQDVSISKIKASDVRGIFTGEKTRFSDGSHAVPVILKGGPAHEVFVRNYCGESPEEFRAQWRKAVFTGQGAMPRAFDSEAALIAYVSETPGAIGYVSRLVPHEGIKLLVAVK